MLTDYERNRIIDFRYRAQSYTPPATYYVGILSAATPAGGTEVTGGGLARAAISKSLAAWSGTQAEGSTTASSGSTGLTSNNVRLQLAATLSAEKTAAYVGIWDASSSGNLLEFYPLTDTDGNGISRTWLIGDEVAIEIGDLEITVS
jgi:hypothetical protein